MENKNILQDLLDHRINEYEACEQLGIEECDENISTLREFYREHARTMDDIMEDTLFNLK